MDITRWSTPKSDWLYSLQPKMEDYMFIGLQIVGHDWTTFTFTFQPSLWSNPHICTWLLEKPWLWLYRPSSAKWCLCFLIHYVCHNFPFKEQASFNFMAVTVLIDFGTQENKIHHCSHFFPHLFAMKSLEQMPWSSFFECWFLSHPFTLFLHLYQEAV